ncbi:MAG: AAA family ATPase [Gammaproteobacteria bacterium]|nr:AAA family ATPase [Gammaproteobacteria bacterium]MBU1655753.1 AAA family ATPase [Gammaproteobacteria bacterium]MBU1959930.1 AAA family ATPase [Gammaproteobacteria bacterium]
MNELKDLEIIIDSGTPIVLIETNEEGRVEALFRRLSTRLGRPLFRWSIATGLIRLDMPTGGATKGQGAAEALGRIMAAPEPGLYLLFDIHHWIDDPLTLRALREVGQNHNRVAHTLVLVAPELGIPPELRSLAARFDLSLPSREQLEQLIQEESTAWGQRNRKSVKASAKVIDALIRNLLGLSLLDAQRLIRTAIHDDGLLTEGDLDGVKQAKYRLLDLGGVLSYEMDTTRFSEVAGLERLKSWLEARRAVFLSDAAPAGLDAPKGILLLGVQGGGKSLAAKSVAGAWGLPLLRLDFGALYNKYYGETERNLRESLKTAAVMAPCILWIDEIEKGLATDDEGGPSKRILGTLLTWMAERKDKVFLVATANDIESLPPELLRKGRFDEIFFVDLPKAPVRAVVFEIHLKKRSQDPKGFDLQLLAEKSEGFTGAEIEQAVVAALYTAHARGESLTTDHIATELANTRPLSVLMAEKIAYLRAWAAERTVPAD